MNENPSVYICDFVKARKDHTCYECRGAIKRGEQYHNHHGVWDGEGCTFKLCNDCQLIMIEADKDADPEETTPFGSLYEAVFESKDSSMINRFIETKAKRGAVVPKWMSDKQTVAASKIEKESK